MVALGFGLIKMFCILIASCILKYTILRSIAQINRCVVSRLHFEHYFYIYYVIIVPSPNATALPINP